MKERKLKKVAEYEIKDIKNESASSDDYYFEFLNTKFNKEIQSFWKLIEMEKHK